MEVNDYLASLFFFFYKRGVLVFATKKGDLSKNWNMHGYKVSKVSDTAGSL